MECNKALYDFYITEYNGSLPENTFKSAIINAQAFLRYATLGRSERNCDMKEVKYALCNIADKYAEVYLNAFDSAGQVGNRQIKSENTDGYSVTYVAEFSDNTTNEKAFKTKALEVAKMWLSGTGLMDRRVKGVCCHAHER